MRLRAHDWMWERVQGALTSGVGIGAKSRPLTTIPIGGSGRLWRGQSLYSPSLEKTNGPLSDGPFAVNSPM